VNEFFNELENSSSLFASAEDDCQIESSHHAALKYINYKFSYYKKIQGRTARATLDWNEGVMNFFIIVLLFLKY
jgi:hypothetical protein